MLDNLNLGTTAIVAVWIGSIALVLLVGTVVWGFAKIVEHSERMAISAELINRQLGRIYESLEDLRGNIRPRNM